LKNIMSYNNEAYEVGYAIRKGMIQKLEEMVNNGFDINNTYEELGCRYSSKTYNDSGSEHDPDITAYTLTGYSYSDKSGDNFYVYDQDYGSSIPWTPLMYVCSIGGRDEMISFLISKGANLDLKDKCGRTALKIAKHVNRNVNESFFH